jgi:glycosyltransferase involved in cell wall biosynthesis
LPIESSHTDWPPRGPANDFVFTPGISVFFPAFNDAPSLPSLLRKTFEVLRRHARDYEVIVVNDGSVDNTGAVLEELRREYAPYLRVITHQKNRGYGGAVRSGFAAAGKEFVFYTDGDGQYDPGDLVALLRQVTPEVGLVNGYKVERRDPWHRVAIGWLYNRFARLLFGVQLRDIDCDFRLVRKCLLDRFPLTSTSGTICVELVHKIELLAPRVVEVPVHHYPRLHGRSQFFRVRSVLTTFLQLIRLFFHLGFLESLLQRAGSWNLFSNPTAPRRAARPSGALPLLLLISALACVAYLRSLTLP